MSELGRGNDQVIRVIHSFEPCQFAEILQLLTLNQSTLQEIRNFMASVNDVLTTLQTAVANETTVDQSVLTFLQGIPSLIAAAVAAANANQTLTADQAAAFQTLSDTITSNAAGLSAAVTANTPAAKVG